MLVALQGDSRQSVLLSDLNDEASVMLDRDIPPDYPWSGPLSAYMHLGTVGKLFLTDHRGHAWVWDGERWQEYLL